MNCWVFVKVFEGNWPTSTWYCNTDIRVDESLAAALLPGLARNFVKASFEGARSVKSVLDDRALTSKGCPANNALMFRTCQRE